MWIDFFIFVPRKRMVDTLMKDTPPQAIVHASSSGWTDSTLFITWLKHFVAFTGCSRQDPNIIVLDGHHSHKTLEAVLYCRENGIELLTLPPHSTHKMQPLDRTYFKPLKSAFNVEADCWMMSNPGRRITVYEMAGLSGKAFLRTALPERAVHGFKACGLWPYDPNVFKDEDFEASLVTEEEAPTDVHSASTETSQNQNPTVVCQEISFLSDNDQTSVSPRRPSNEQLSSPPMTSNCRPTSSLNASSPRGENLSLAFSERPPGEQLTSPFSPNDARKKSGYAIQVSGDGRCFFRSLVAWMNIKLQSAVSDEHGRVENPVLRILETTSADGLRAQVIAYMCDHLDDYQSLPQ